MTDLSQLTNLPPQATGATLPGQAMAAGNTPNIQPVDPIALLRDANFGDGSDARIKAIQASAPANGGGGLSALAGGGTAAAPPTNGTAPAPEASPAEAAPQADPVSTLQNVAMMRLSFLKSLRDQNIPIPTQVKVIMDQAQQMGRKTMTPAQAELIARMFSIRNLDLAEQRIKSGDVPFLLKIGHDLPDSQSYLDLGNDMKQYEDTVAHQRTLATLAGPMNGMESLPLPLPSNPMPALAGGGKVVSGSAIVGDAGPEVISVRPDGTTVTPISRLPRMQEGGVVTPTLDVDTTLDPSLISNLPPTVTPSSETSPPMTPALPSAPPAAYAAPVPTTASPVTSRIAAPAGLQGLAGFQVPIPKYNLADDITTTYLSGGDINKYKNALAAQQQKALQLIESQQKIATTIRDNYKGLYDDAKDIMQNYPRVEWETMIRQRAAERGIQVNPALLIGTRSHALNDEVASRLLDNYMAGATLPELHALGLDPTKQAEFITKAGQARKAQEAVSPEKAAEERQQAALRIASQLRQAQRPPTETEIQALDSAGLEAYQVDIPGVAGGKMWSTRPKGATPTAAQPAAASPAVSATPVSVQTPEEAAKLPPGQKYTTPDGRTFTRTGPAVAAMPSTAPTEPTISATGLARTKQEAKALPMTQQKLMTQIETAQAPIEKLTAMLADPKYKPVIAKMGPQMTVQNPITGTTRALPFTSDTEGTSHDSISHPLNSMWYNYKQGGKDMTDPEREMMAVLGTISASGWQGLTSGIRNRAVIEDVKQHIPRPWDDPALIIDKIRWIKQWYGAIKAGTLKSAQTLKDLQDETAPNPFTNIGTAK